MTQPASLLGPKGRIVAPEILDNLAPDDPRAVRSRGDLRRVNALMLQSSIAARLLLRHCPTPRRIAEIGGGDGAFSLSVARRLADRWKSVEVLLLDRLSLVSPATEAGFGELGWTLSPVTADIFDWLDGDGPGADCICANLFLHHFDENDLLRLFRAIPRKAPLLLATEPRRSALALAGSRLLWALGANAVTRHDAPASVRAGFRGDEIGQLWSRAGGLPLEERKAGPFSHVFAGRSAR